MQPFAIIGNVAAGPPATSLATATCRTSSGSPSFGDIVVGRINSAAPVVHSSTPETKNAQPAIVGNQVRPNSKANAPNESTSGQTVTKSMHGAPVDKPGTPKIRDNKEDVNVKLPAMVTSTTLTTSPALPIDSNSAKAPAESEIPKSFHASVTPELSIDARTVNAPAGSPALTAEQSTAGGNSLAEPASTVTSAANCQDLGEIPATAVNTQALPDLPEAKEPPNSTGTAAPSLPETIPTTEVSDLPAVEASKESDASAVAVSEPANDSGNDLVQALPFPPSPSTSAAVTASKVDAKSSPRPTDIRTSRGASTSNQDVAGNFPLASIGDLVRKNTALTGKENAQTIPWTLPNPTASQSRTEKNGDINPVLSLPGNSAKISAEVHESPVSTNPSASANQQKGKSTGTNATSVSTNDSTDKFTGANERKGSNTAATDTASQTVRQAQPSAAPNVPLNTPSAGSAPINASLKNDVATKNVATDTPAKETATTAMNDEDDAGAPETRVVNTAQLSGGNAHSEMHIAMQAEKLGAVELHARVTGEQVGAAITVEKKEAHAALAVELPSLQQALSDMHLHIEHVSLSQGVLHSTAGNAGNSGGSHQQQQRLLIQSQYRQGGDEAATISVGLLASDSSGIFDTQGRLSVRV